MTRKLISAKIGWDDEDVIALTFSDGSVDHELLYHPEPNAKLQLEDHAFHLSSEEFDIVDKELVRFSVEELGFKDEYSLQAEAEAKANKIISELESKTDAMNNESKAVLYNILVRELLLK